MFCHHSHLDPQIFLQLKYFWRCECGLHATVNISLVWSASNKHLSCCFTASGNQVKSKQILIAINVFYRLSSNHFMIPSGEELRQDLKMSPAHKFHNQLYNLGRHLKKKLATITFRWQGAGQKAKLLTRHTVRNSGVVLQYYCNEITRIKLTQII